MKKTNLYLNLLTTVIVYLWANNSFADELTHRSSDKSMDFAVGRNLFKKLWIAAPATTKASDGLGPLYNARSCFQCHINAGRGQIPDANQISVSIIMRLSIPLQSNDQEESLRTSQQNPIAEPNYGTQFQTFAVTGLASEGDLKINYSDMPVKLAGGETVVLHKPEYQLTNLQYGELHPNTLLSPRLAPQLMGMGLLANINERDILLNSDPNDQNQDGISGKPNRVWSREFNKIMLGRFGHKAGVATLNEQNQSAFSNDLGLSTPLFPQAWGDCTANQLICQNAPHGDDASQQHLEAPKKVTDAVLHYVSHLSVPTLRHTSSADFIEGQKHFVKTGCIACHQPSFQTRNTRSSSEIIFPYTDMLLHDMGEGLADNRPEGEANGQEWRTAPLWGIGLTESINGHDYYLHDGRARTLQQAILWHGGEATQARDNYTILDKNDRQLLLKFLGKL